MVLICERCLSIRFVFSDRKCVCWISTSTDNCRSNGPVSTLSILVQVVLVDYLYTLETRVCWSPFRYFWIIRHHGPLTRYLTLQVAQAPGIPGTFSPGLKRKPRHASRHVRHARDVMHVGIANPRWQRKRSRHAPCASRNCTYLVHGIHLLPCSL